jgi:ADP-ribose pyrophosphatase
MNRNVELLELSIQRRRGILVAKRVVLRSKKRVFDGFFKIDEVELSYERFDGQMSEPVRRLCFERGDSVAAIVFNPDSQRAIFVNQFKYPTYAKGPGWIIETIAGMVEHGEPPESALRREVLEEMGYEAQKVDHIATFYVSPGGSSERIILFYVEVCAAGKVAKGGGVAGEAEDIETLEFSMDELDSLLSTGKIQDAKTIIGIQWLQKNLHGLVRR